MLPRFSRHVEQLIVAAGVCLLLLPKVNLIGFAGETAGIRIDDVALAGMDLMLIIGFISTGRHRLTRVELWVAAFVAAGLFSNVVNECLANRSSPLYSLRLVEYFTFFYIGSYYFARLFSLATLAWWILTANGIAITLQRLDIIGELTADGFVRHVSRPAGLTGGPWEIGTLINMCYSILIFDRSRPRSTWFAFITFVMSSALLLLTGSRMPAIAQLVLLLVFLYQRSRSRPRFVLAAGLSLATVWVCFLIVPSKVAERSAHLSSRDNLQMASEIYRDVEPLQGSVIYEEGSGMANVDDTDMSLLMRSVKWSIAIKTCALHTYALIVGIGPGTLGSSLDGGWLRVLAETGPIGLVVFVIMLRDMWKLSPEMNGIVVSLCISMLMIDVHIAYKVMSLVFFSAGYYFARRSLSDKRLYTRSISPAARLVKISFPSLERS